MATKTATKKAEKIIEEEAPGRVRHWLDNAFIKRVAEAKDTDGKSFPDIAEEEEVSKGQVALAYLRSKIPVKSRQALADDPEALASETVRMRDKESASWGVISATLGVPESAVRKVYEDTTGNPHKGNRIGKGGRRPSGEAAAPTKKAPTTAKKTTATSGKVIPMVEMNLEQLQARLDGKSITVGRSAGKSERIGVATVKSLKGGEMEFTDSKGKVRTVKVADITKATR